MLKKKILIFAAVCLCVILFAIELEQLEQKANQTSNLSQIKQTFQTDVQELKDGKYPNLTATDFSVSIEDIEQIYNLEIRHWESNTQRSFLENFSLMTEDGTYQIWNIVESFWRKSYKDRTIQENFEKMNVIMDKFFQEDFDKSYVQVDFCWENIRIQMSYDEFQNIDLEKEYQGAESLAFYGNRISEGGYMVQMFESLYNIWFSRGELGTTMPSTNKYKARYSYLAGKRQAEDVLLRLADGEIWLSELESEVRNYLNTDEFPLPQTDGISYEIGEALILENGEYEGVCFMVRRMYQGVPFAYGIFGSGDSNYDMNEISYARKEVPDTMRAFQDIECKVVELQEVDVLISAGTALELISEHIGENGMYEVQGIELVYKSTKVSDERYEQVADILKPKWRIVLRNHNGWDGRIIYYVDVVTGEVQKYYE